MTTTIAKSDFSSTLAKFTDTLGEVADNLGSCLNEADREEFVADVFELHNQSVRLLEVAIEMIGDNRHHPLRRTRAALRDFIEFVAPAAADRFAANLVNEQAGRLYALPDDSVCHYVKWDDAPSYEEIETALRKSIEALESARAADEPNASSPEQSDVPAQCSQNADMTTENFDYLETSFAGESHLATDHAVGTECPDEKPIEVTLKQLAMLFDESDASGVAKQWTGGGKYSIVHGLKRTQGTGPGRPGVYLLNDLIRRLIEKNYIFAEEAERIIDFFSHDSEQHPNLHLAK